MAGISVPVDKKPDRHFKIPFPVTKNRNSDLEIPSLGWRVGILYAKTVFLAGIPVFAGIPGSQQLFKIFTDIEYFNESIFWRILNIEYFNESIFGRILNTEYFNESILWRILNIEYFNESIFWKILNIEYFNESIFWRIMVLNIMINRYFDE